MAVCAYDGLATLHTLRTRTFENSKSVLGQRRHRRWSSWTKGRKNQKIFNIEMSADSPVTIIIAWPHRVVPWH